MLARIFFLERGQVCGIKACHWMEPQLIWHTQTDIQLQFMKSWKSWKFGNYYASKAHNLFGVVKFSLFVFLHSYSPHPPSHFLSRTMDCVIIGQWQKKKQIIFEHFWIFEVFRGRTPTQDSLLCSVYDYNDCDDYGYYYSYYPSSNSNLAHTRRQIHDLIKHHLERQKWPLWTVRMS